MLINNNLNSFFYNEPIFINAKKDYLSSRFVYREELDQILKILSAEDHYRIIVLGEAGTGKSTLLHMVSRGLYGTTSNNIFYAQDFINYGFLPINETKDPIIIDGLDEAENPYELLRYIQGKNINRLICTSRIVTKRNSTSFINLISSDFFSHIITLKPLTKNQVFELVKNLGLDNRLEKHLISDLQANIKGGSLLTPKDILQQLIELANTFYFDSFYNKHNTLLYQYGRGVDFNSNPILFKNELILPSKEIINGVTIVNDTLLRQVKKDPKILRCFTPREFECLVCELLDKEGYKVKLTKQTRDGGKNIIVIEKSILGEFCIYVECKKFDKARPVNVGLVRELYGTIMADNATAGMIMTTSYFSNDAIEYTKNIKHRMSLRDYNDLIQEINKIDSI